MRTKLGDATGFHYFLPCHHTCQASNTCIELRVEVSPWYRTCCDTTRDPHTCAGLHCNKQVKEKPKRQKKLAMSRSLLSLLNEDRKGSSEIFNLPTRKQKIWPVNYLLQRFPKSLSLYYASTTKKTHAKNNPQTSKNEHKVCRRIPQCSRELSSISLPLFSDCTSHSMHQRSSYHSQDRIPIYMYTQQLLPILNRTPQDRPLGATAIHYLLHHRNTAPQEIKGLPARVKSAQNKWQTTPSFSLRRGTNSIQHMILHACTHSKAELESLQIAATLPTSRRDSRQALPPNKFSDTRLFVAPLYPSFTCS